MLAVSGSVEPDGTEIHQNTSDMISEADARVDRAPYAKSTAQLAPVRKRQKWTWQLTMLSVCLACVSLQWIWDFAEDRGSRQEAKQKIERTQAALEAQSKKKSLRMEALETKSRHLASLEEERLWKMRRLDRTAMESEMKVGSREHRSEFFGVSVADALEEEALLQRFVQLKSELEEHQAVLEKLAEAQKKAPQKQVGGSVRPVSSSVRPFRFVRSLGRMLLDLRSSLDAAKSTAKGEARKTRQAEEQIDRQRQEVLAEALKSTLSEQKAEHEKFMKVSELRVRRAELALKQEAVAAACSVEKERLAELRREFEKVRAGSLQKIEDAKKELQQDVPVRIYKPMPRVVVLSDLCHSGDTGGDKHTEDAESRKSQLLKASKESREAEMKYEALQKDQKHLQVSQGNELYSKLQEVEQAESQKVNLEKEIVLVQQQAMGQFSGDLQAWAKEVQSLRVTAKVQSHEDELLHWKQASESPAIASQLQVQAAEGLLRQKESTLQDQLASKETLLQELEQQAQSEVRCLVDYAESSSTPSHRRPTRDNIIAELQWLTGNAKQGDNVLLYFSGYGAQQPDAEVDGLYQGYLVPADFADDLPEDLIPDITSEVERCCKTEAGLGNICNSDLRLLPVLGASAPPSIRSRGPPRFKKLKPPSEQATAQVKADRCRQEVPWKQRAWLHLACHSTSRKFSRLVQGVATWAFVKAMDGILQNLRRKYRWIQQTPVIQLSASANVQAKMVQGDV
ncbi:hypothetical protein AK812_SmicGene31899 [Symbiodinium microadriaticum]|uniref:Peptidase C14 caspase domain-containing protein n=1 Tax=Symbiodinium microadriaticum TaxID=2951 RepID=A0A1Q9CVJ4_SYMMI|nr:hypothetical protein AK812_SmicGene31899 [Symbiodinium microadriaticum]